ncbi:MAG: ATP-binding cassette domain-containing protein, partial [Paracoccaceae bacterium]|nr:ATP-binding cassette domain-containing protein [Paracoccaceae bacterium]
MHNFLEVSDLHKTYDDSYRALEGVNLSVRPGEILALLGPNGAGKTTLIASICGLSKPTSGSVQVGGYD